MKKSINTIIQNKKEKSCLICSRIEDIKQNRNPHFVIELETGYVVIGDNQFFKGYTLFLCKQHKNELHELDPKFKNKFLQEMSTVAEAVYKTFKPKKLNYELLGNTDNHMHWHIFPRHNNDPLPERTVWNIPKETRNAESTKPNKEELKELTKKLKRELQQKVSQQTDKK